MTIRLRTAIFLLVLAQGLAGCSGSGSSSSPSAPSVPVATQRPQQTPLPGLAGYVLDTAFRAVADAAVEVVDGPLAGTSMTSDSAGRFGYPGTIDGTVTFRARKEGYIAATQPSHLSAPGGMPWVIFYLEVITPTVNIAGDFTLTFLADSACADLPGEARARTYDATITPESSANVPANTRFTVALSGAQFLEGYKSFTIGVAGSDLGIFFENEGPALLEAVAPNTYLAFWGWTYTSLGTSVPSRIATSFEGTIDYCVTKSAMGSFYSCSPSQAVSRATCTSKNHQLILTRQ